MKRKPKEADQLELRRWCIESAIRWPTENSYAGMVSGGGGYKPAPDIIDRAEKIFTWVQKH